MTEDLKLKSCPFCGNKDIKFMYEFPNSAKTFCIVCSNCGAQIRKFAEFYDTEETCMNEAVKHWNTRGGQSEEDNIQLEETVNIETEKDEFDFIGSVKFLSFEMNWTQAMNYIKTTSIETGDIWFMPNIETLKYIIKNCRKFGLSRRDLVDDVFWSCENFQDFECKPVILVSAETETRLTLDRVAKAKLIMVKKKN